VSAFTLWLIRIKSQKRSDTAKENVIESIKHGLAYLWNDATLRTWFFIIAGINLFFNGPFIVGIPVLADTRFPEGAAAFGIIVSGMGIGSLIGTILAGLLPKPRASIMGSVVLVVIASQGVNLALIGFTANTYLAAFLACLIGMASGYIVILWVTWLQSITPPDMLGRVWSIVMFSSIGIQPISQSLAGALIGYNITLVFVVSGSLLAAMCVLAAFDHDVRAMRTDAMPEITVQDAIRKTGELPIINIRSTGELPALTNYPAASE
jgi:MFS family permease